MSSSGNPLERVAIDLAQDKKDLEDQVNALVQDKKEAHHRITKLEADASEAIEEVRNLHWERQVNMDRNANLENALHDAIASRITEEQKNTALQAAITTLEAMGQTLENERLAAESSVSTLKRQIDQTTPKRDRSSLISRVEAVEAALQQKLQDAQQRLTASAAENTTLREQLHVMERRTTIVLQHHDAPQQCAEDAEATFQQLREEKKRATAAESEMPNPRRRRAEDLLHSAVNNLVEEEEQEPYEALEARVHQAEAELQLLREERERTARDQERGRAELRLYRAFYHHQRQGVEEVAGMERAFFGGEGRVEGVRVPPRW